MEDEEDIIKIPALTIVISTYNQVASLEKLLRQLFSQFRELLVYAKKAKDLIEDIELIIVDNGSTDGTADLIFKIIAEKQNFNLETRYIFEKEEGLSVTRNRAIKESKGETLVFISDEVELADHWLKEVYDIAKQRLTLLLYGCRVKAKWGLDLPDWLNLEPPFAIKHSCFPSHDYGEEERVYPFSIGHESSLLVKDEYDNGDAPAGLYVNDINMINKLQLKLNQLTDYKIEIPNGACFLVSRDVFKILHGFTTDLADVGAIRNFAEEMEFFNRASQADLELKYQPQIVVSHPVDKKLLTQKYILEAYRRWGFMTAYLKEPLLEGVSNTNNLKFKLYFFKILLYLSYLLIDPIKTFWLEAQCAEIKGEMQGFGVKN